MHNCPSDWRQDTLFGFKNVADLGGQFSSLQKDAGITYFWTVYSFQNGAMATILLEDMCERNAFGKASLKKAEKNLECRPGYTSEKLRRKINRIMGTLPSLMAMGRKEKGYTKFSEFPLVGSSDWSNL